MLLIELLTASPLLARFFGCASHLSRSAESRGVTQRFFGFSLLISSLETGKKRQVSAGWSEVRFEFVKPKARKAVEVSA
jgi:hypothetical protein